MNINYKNQNKLEILLSNKEVIEFGILNAYKSSNDKLISKIISKLLSIAEEKTMTSFVNKKMSVDIFFDNTIGGKITFNIIPSYKIMDNEPISINSYFFSFDEIEDIIALSQVCYNFYSQFIYKSNLYFWENKYYLFLMSTMDFDEFLKGIILEFSSEFIENPFFIEKIEEYGSIIIKNNAIEKLNYYFNKSLSHCF